MTKIRKTKGAKSKVSRARSRSASKGLIERKYVKNSRASYMRERRRFKKEARGKVDILHANMQYAMFCIILAGTSIWITIYKYFGNYGVFVWTFLFLAVVAQVLDVVRYEGKKRCIRLGF